MSMSERLISIVQVLLALLMKLSENIVLHLGGMLVKRERAWRKLQEMPYLSWSSIGPMILFSNWWTMSWICRIPALIHSCLRLSGNRWEGRGINLFIQMISDLTSVSSLGGLLWYAAQDFKKTERFESARVEGQVLIQRWRECVPHSTFAWWVQLMRKTGWVWFFWPTLTNWSLLLIWGP